MDDGKYDLPNDKTLHVWTQPEGARWACVAYDHGPFCRRCEPTDEVLEALLENVLDGRMEVKDDRDDGMVFKVTEIGKRAVEQMIDQNREQ